ncbi:MAG: OsmC family protein [Bacteroidota bacterium]|nr:OsmC family protein [Bacteroidota bacterium]MDP4217903.1 OsmC family protein [Bacteroidota bacterium]MDP4247694.1 OsmC family protein [Bacteroidota bacterium]MDP4253884.1 OsmC family protein [Bacteroidota bacterium]MDP4260585.1 OsmC family protein [Bacteroidota bacterium]
MEKEHHYSIAVVWTGNKGEGTKTYRSYDRDHLIAAEGKVPIDGSSDPKFHGSPARYNPEEFLVASLSSCHMLWYLHLCAVNKVVVTDYRDQANGEMMERPDGSGYFRSVMLNPVITVTDASMIAKAESLHEEAHKLCFIANSVNFPVSHKATCKVASR